MGTDYAALAGGLIEQFEGFRTAPYQDGGGKWTIGFGSTTLPDGSPVTATTPPVTLAVGRAMYQAAIVKLHASIVLRLSTDLPDAGKAAALVDFAYNLGLDNLFISHLWQDVASNNFPAVAEQFLLWDHERINGVETVIDGLVRRRKAEAALFTRGF